MTEPASRTSSRREWLSKVLMGTGLLLSYGLLGIEVVLYILPRRVGPALRKVFAGRVEQYDVGSVREVHDLEGNRILVRRSAEGFDAFSSVCPHLGCRVHWEAHNRRFFCPCHRGVFDPEGRAVSGPPADAGQNLARLPVEVEPESGVVYLQVKDRRGGKG